MPRYSYFVRFSNQHFQQSVIHTLYGKLSRSKVSPSMSDYRLHKHLYRFLRGPFVKVLLITKVNLTTYDSHRWKLWCSHLIDLLYIGQFVNPLTKQEYSFTVSFQELHAPDRLDHDWSQPQPPVSLHLVIFVIWLVSNWRCFLQIMHALSIQNDTCLCFLSCQLLTICWLHCWQSFCLYPGCIR